MAKSTIALFSIVVALLPFFIATCEGKNNMIEISRMAVFKVAVLRNQKPVVVYFTKSPCPQCKSIRGDLERLAKANDERMYLAIADMDKYPNIKAEFDIKTVPTTRTYFKGELLREVEGPLAGPIRAIANNAIKIGEQNSKKN